MALSFYNTMTRAVEPFRPIKAGEVRLYTCGPTVYDHAHIGNFRTYAFEDLLRRWLEYRGYRVTQVMNITDVEDKIIRRHRESGKPINEVTAPYIQGFFDDLQVLRIEKAEHYPRATEYIDQMVEIVKGLLEKDVAYRGEDGSIYYAITKFPRYGRLAEVQNLQAGARVKQDEYEKETASDFALWKAWDPEDGDVFWETDLGKGRPGWHLECSAMSMSLLGNHFDMHTGGEDNKFPHHENEIAQSEAYTGETFVNYWLHSRHLLVEDTKMAKSKGNFFTVKALLEDRGVPWYALRYLYISSHYRSQLNFTFKGLEQARATVENMLEFLRRVRDDRTRPGDVSGEMREAVERARTEFEAAMDDDLNSSGALGRLHTLISEYNRLASPTGGDAALVADLFVSLDRVLGLELDRAMAEESLSAEEQALVDERQAARASRDFKRADDIRGQLQARGIVLEDTPQGVRWKRIQPSLS